MKEKKDSTSSELPSLNRDEIKHKVLTEKAKMYIKPHRGCATSDYLMSVREKNCVKDFPEWDSSQKSLTRSMIESKKKLSIAENLLRQKREEFVRNCQDRDKQIKELTGKELKLKESFEFFDEFVKENMEKRERAVERKRIEREARDKIMQDISRVNRRIGRLRIIRQEMMESIEENSKYRDYLLDAGVKMPKEFSSDPEKIIERYELLRGIRVELEELQENQINNIQKTSTTIHEETGVRSDHLITLRNQLTDLHKREQLAGQQVWKWRGILREVSKKSSDSGIEGQRLKKACDELYLQVCKDLKRSADSPVKAAPSEQLRLVRERILELRQIIRVARQRAFRTFSDVPNSSFSLKERESRKKSRSATNGERK
ncbi:coiled-coil domain-containing protein 42-like [Nilaparvata lugens]|uniref:coiled-coil domain-containing protein 42-like n=1 Tax=Nilaparvata lugens TaxID=108931 RepID=UPI00193D5E73|nr:coiled-coil domain-containing protein 42-like [Nilaparvata lugens]